MPKIKTTWRDWCLKDFSDYRRDYDLDYVMEKNMLYLWQISAGIWKYGGGDDNKRFFVELERRFFYAGQSGIVSHDGKPAAVDVSTYGLDIYGLPTDYNFVFRNGDTPAQYNEKIGVDGVLCYNNYMRVPTAFSAFDYALKLSHIDLSIIAETVNTRAQDLFIADNDAGRESADLYYKNLYNGRLSAVVNKANISFTHDRSSTQKATILRDLLDARKSVLAEYYSMIGVKRLPDKKERLITEEVKNDSALMLLNIEEMFECRKNAIEECNKLFGTTYTVECVADINGNGTPDNEEPERGLNYAGTSERFI